MRKGEIRVFAEDAAGARKPLATVPPGATGARVTIPAGTRRLAAVLRGEDDAGEFVAVGESAIK